jgi:S-adenosylmethionine uptake transporter
MESATTTDHAIRGPLLALAGFAVFSTHDALVKSLADYSVFQIIFFAMLFGYVPFSLVRIAETNPTVIKARNLKLVLLRSALLVAALCFAFLAFTTLPLVEAYILIFTGPVFITVMAIVFLNEQVRAFRWIAMTLGLLGVIVVLRPTIDTLSIGHLYGVLTSVCGSGGAIIARKIGNSENAATLILFPLIGNILVTGTMLVFVYVPMPLADLGVMFLIGALALCGQLLMLNAYRSSNAALVAPMQYSQMVWAVIFGVMFFGETIDTYVVVGSVITILSGVLIIWRESRSGGVQPNLRTRNPRMVIAATNPGQAQDENT